MTAVCKDFSGKNRDRMCFTQHKSMFDDDIETSNSVSLVPPRTGSTGGSKGSNREVV